MICGLCDHLIPAGPVRVTVRLGVRRVPVHAACADREFDPEGGPR